MDPLPGEVTHLLAELNEGRQQAAPKLFELLYGELRRLAQHQLYDEAPDHTLPATALVNEAYLRLVNSRQSWRNRAHFFAIASGAMRRILVDHARAKRAAKRPNSQQKVNLDEAPLLFHQPDDQIIMLDVALQRLSQLDPRQARIVELRYFGGLTADETAEALGISTITVQREWAVAKAWLHGELTGPSAAV